MMLASSKAVFIHLALLIASSASGEEFYSFEDLKSNEAVNLKITNTDCNFKGERKGCNHNFAKTAGECSLTLTLRQLLPSVDLHTLSEGFVVTDKLSVEEIVFDTCSGENYLRFKMKSTESYPIVAQYISIAAAGVFKIGWKHSDDELTFKKMKMEIDGSTSIANDHAVKINLDKPISREDFDITYTLGEVSSKNFLAQFSIDSDGFKPIADSRATVPVFPEGMESEKARLATMEFVIQGATVTGIFAPGQGFELTVKGTVPAPELLNDAGNLYLIVQDFKKPDADATVETYDTPAAALFATYKGEKVVDLVYALTAHTLPSDLEIFKGVTEICITAATRAINFVNSPELRKLTDKFSPAKGLEVIEQGLHLMHYSPVKDAGIKNIDGEVIKKILFRVDISKEKMIWKSPQLIEATMQQIAHFAWTETKGINRFPIHRSTNCTFGGLFYLKTDNSIILNFNFSQLVQVLDDGIVTLASTTIELTSTRNPTRGTYRKWELSGFGKEIVLDEQVSITIENNEHRTTVSADLDSFNMPDIRNKTGATYLPPSYVQAFNYCLQFPVSELKFEAVFEKPKVLKFKGKPGFLIHKENDHVMEAIRFTKPDEHPGLKVGLLFRKTSLDEVVNRMYQDEHFIQTTWVRPQQIVVVMKKESSSFKFDRSVMADVDEMANFESGIALAIRDLDLSVCGVNGKTVSMCEFLKTMFGESLAVTLRGRMNTDQMLLKGAIGRNIEIGNGVQLRNPEFRIKSNHSGDQISLKGVVFFKRTQEEFPASISMIGSNELVFKVKGGRESNDMFPLPYVKMNPLQANFQIPPRRIQTMEFFSRLHIGTDAKFSLTIPGSQTHQYVGISDTTNNRFYGTKNGVRTENILRSFKMEEPDTLIRGSNFSDRLVIAYNSKQKVWEIPEVNLKINQGFWFLGKLHMKTGSIYQTKMELIENMGIKATVKLPPILYKPKKEGKRELKSEKASLSLYYKKDQTKSGPNLVVKFSNLGATQVIKGYLETYGMEGPFEMKATMKSRTKASYLIEMTGPFYQEIDQALLQLTAEGVGLPINLEIQYKLDLIEKVASRASDDIRASCVQLEQDAREGRKKAAEAVKLITEIRASHQQKLDAYTKEIESLGIEIRKKNDGIDSACQSMSEDCIRKCKTVPLAGIEWKEECVELSGGKSMKCMVWNEDKERCVQVFCLLRCEAEKISSSREACKNLEDIRLMVSRFKEMKVRSKNVEQILSLIDEGKKLADDAKLLIDEKTDLGGELSELLKKPAESLLVTFNILKVDTPLSEIHAPCFPFDMDFVFNTSPAKPYAGKHDICFNGEFYKNVGMQVLKSTYPLVDDMYKTLEEAELRYVRIDGIKKSLEKTEKEMNTDSPIPSTLTPDAKRSSISDGGSSILDTVEARLMKIAKRSLPKFTTKGDNTMMAFRHYSPWAISDRSHPFSSVKTPKAAKRYDISSLQDKSPCKQARKVVAHYRDIISGVRSVAENYQKGKSSFLKNQHTVKQQLKESYEALSGMANTTRLAPAEIKDMFFWYDYTKSGMQHWLKEFSSQLSQHNRLGLKLWKGEMEGIYGANSLIHEVEKLGHDAYSRSNIGHAQKRSTTNSLTEVKEKIAELMGDPNLTLEQAKPMIGQLNSHIETLHKSTMSCF